MKLFQRYDNEVNEVNQKSRFKLDCTAFFLIEEIHLISSHQKNYFLS